MIVCLSLLLAVPTVIKYLPGREPKAEKLSDGDSGATVHGRTEDRGRTEGTPPRQTQRRGGRSLGEVLYLVIMLSPFLIGMIVFGVIIGFGPGEDVAGAALYIGAMQMSAVVGRFAAGAIADRFSPFALNLLGLALAIIGLVVTVIVSGGMLFLAMMIIGLGLGTLQSASLVMAFSNVSTPAKASVAWNMNFDIGLAIAGVLGGLGFTYLGDSATFLVCAALLLLTGVLSLILRALRRSR